MSRKLDIGIGLFLFFSSEIEYPDVCLGNWIFGGKVEAGPEEAESQGSRTTYAAGAERNACQESGGTKTGTKEGSAETKAQGDQ